MLVGLNLLSFKCTPEESTRFQNFKINLKLLKMTSLRTNGYILAIATILMTFVYHNLGRELSLISPRVLKGRFPRKVGPTSLIKKAFVNIETDILSAISPLTFAGTLYSWKILTPAFAQAQYKALEEEYKNRRTSNTNEVIPTVLSSNLDEVNFYLFQDSINQDNYTRLNLAQYPVPPNVLQVPRTEQLKILIHGFQSGPALPFAKEIKDAYLKETNHSVIIVDWEELSLPKHKLTLLYYPAVTANALKVGEKVATLIQYLLETNVITDVAQVHIVGHSLGAHAGGYAGDLINSRYGRKIGRITALDAAFLAFLGPDVKLRLDKDDAKFVDAIHTSGIGIYDPIAHVDFYPNGGRNQVSCYNPEQYKGSQRSPNEAFSRAFEQFIQSCSHARAYHYFIKSIKREDYYWACKCLNWKDYRTFCKDSCTHRERFGEYVSPTARGKYFLEIEP